MEIDSSAAADMSSHKSLADSYVSTSDPVEPTSRAQVLEELRARIRELEGSQLKMRPTHDEEHFKCYLCKVSKRKLFYEKRNENCEHCEYFDLQDSKKPCPQCKMVTSSNELRKIHV